jgi:hypothetical protein
MGPAGAGRSQRLARCRNGIGWIRVGRCSRLAFQRIAEVAMLPRQVGADLRVRLSTYVVACPQVVNNVREKKSIKGEL